MTHRLGIPILQKRIKHIDLLQLALLVKGQLRRYRRLSLIGFNVVLRGFTRRLEPRVYAALYGFLEGDFGSEEVDGPLGEYALVVLVHDL